MQRVPIPTSLKYQPQAPARKENNGAMATGTSALEVHHIEFDENESDFKAEDRKRWRLWLPGACITRAQALDLLLQHADNQNIREMIVDDMREALEVGELPRSEIFSELTEIHQELLSARQNLDFWTGVVNRNLHRELDGDSHPARSLLKYLKNHPELEQRHQSNVRRLREGLEWLTQLEEQERNH